jgi:hypothetical protein
MAALAALPPEELEVLRQFAATATPQEQEELRNFAATAPLEEREALKQFSLTATEEQKAALRQAAAEAAAEAAMQSADEQRKAQNPAYAAFLQAQGLSESQIDDEIALRQSLFQEDARRRSEAYARATDRAIEGTQMDFENRGLFRSGTRLNREAKTRERIGFDLEQEQYMAQRAQEELQRRLEQERLGLSREAAAMRLQMATEAAANEIATGATSTSPAPSYSSPTYTQPRTSTTSTSNTTTTRRSGTGGWGSNYR